MKLLGSLLEHVSSFLTWYCNYIQPFLNWERKILFSGLWPPHCFLDTTLTTRSMSVLIVCGISMSTDKREVLVELKIHMESILTTSKTLTSKLMVVLTFVKKRLLTELYQLISSIIHSKDGMEISMITQSIMVILMTIHSMKLIISREWSPSQQRNLMLLEPQQWFLWMIMMLPSSSTTSRVNLFTQILQIPIFLLSTTVLTKTMFGPSVCQVTINLQYSISTLAIFINPLKWHTYLSGVLNLPLQLSSLLKSIINSSSNGISVSVLNWLNLDSHW